MSSWRFVRCYIFFLDCRKRNSAKPRKNKGVSNDSGQQPEWQTICIKGPGRTVSRMSEDPSTSSSTIREGKYTNCFQIGHNAFEFVLEFGQSYGDQPEYMHTHLVTSPAFAARLSELLLDALSQYQARFGPISIDGEPLQGTPGG